MIGFSSQRNCLAASTRGKFNTNLYINMKLMKENDVDVERQPGFVWAELMLETSASKIGYGGCITFIKS